MRLSAGVKQQSYSKRDIEKAKGGGQGLCHLITFLTRMSFTPCPSPSRQPSYSTKTQDEINHQALRENLQHYYMSQQKLRQKQKEVERLEKKKIERTTSASSTSSATGATGNKTATTIAAVNAGLVALGPIPLQIGRNRSPTPVPDPPVPSPIIHQKKECQGISLKANCRHNRQAKKRPTHLKLYYSGTESSCSPKSNSTSTSVSTGTSSAASPGLESPALPAGKMFHSHSSPRGGGSPRTPRSPRIKLQSETTEKAQKYLVMPQLSPIPPSPQPSLTPSSMNSVSLNEASILQRLGSASGSKECSGKGSLRSLTSNSPRRSPSPIRTGNLALLASRRKSAAVQQRRTSNFLELPVCDYEQRQRRHCSLPERSYNPRTTPNELYRLRSFSIKPNGGLIKHGDLIAMRRKSKSSSSTSTRYNSRATSPMGSQNGSRDISPARSRSPDQSSCTSSWRTTGKNSSNDVSGEEEYEEIVEEPELEENTVEKIRVCMMGDNGVGKTALVSQFLTSDYIDTYDASLDEEYGERSVSVNLDGVESELNFIDHTAEEMSVENMIATYEPHACVVVYSVVDGNSFDMAAEIISYLWRFGFSKKATVLLVANKVDLERSRLVTCEEGRKLAVSFDAKFIETSAGIQHNVDELLVGVLKQVRLRGEQASMSTSKSKKCEDDTEEHRSLPSPLRTLQAARDILTRACLSSNKKRPMDCENLHIL